MRINKVYTQLLTHPDSICPGRYMADNSIFIAIAFILKVFSITPAKDGNGNEIPVNVAFTSGMISLVDTDTSSSGSMNNLTRLRCRHPRPFQCEFKTRSEAAKSLIFDIIDN